MLDLKRFLRFEISGYVAILYGFLFCIAFYDLDKVKELGLLTNVKLLEFSVTGFILSAPIGFLMHQVDITIFSPFRKWRYWWPERRVIEKIGEIISSKKKMFSDIKGQAILELAMSSKGLEYIDDEIGNRYSYYYARMEAGLFSPIVGFILFLLSTHCICDSYGICFRQLTSFFSLASVLISLMIVVISVLVVYYCKEILNELNDLECIALSKETDKIKKIINDYNMQE